LGPVLGLDCEQRPLAEALRELAEIYGLNIVVDRRVTDIAKEPVTASLRTVFARRRSACSPTRPASRR